MHDTGKFLALKKENHLDDLILILGGTIMDFEKEKLQDMGVDGVFQPNVGSPEDIVDFLVDRIDVQ